MAAAKVSDKKDKSHAELLADVDALERLLLNDETGEFTALAETALTEVFHRFDAPTKDGGLDPAELRALAMVTNGAPFPQDFLDEIEMTVGFDKAGRLSLDGLISIFHVQTTANPAETLKDLMSLGYDHKLQLVSTPGATTTPAAAAAGGAAADSKSATGDAKSKAVATGGAATASSAAAAAAAAAVPIASASASASAGSTNAAADSKSKS